MKRRYEGVTHIVIEVPELIFDAASTSHDAFRGAVENAKGQLGLRMRSRRNKSNAPAPSDRLTAIKLKHEYAAQAEPTDADLWWLIGEVDRLRASSQAQHLETQEAL